MSSQSEAAENSSSLPNNPEYEDGERLPLADWLSNAGNDKNFAAFLEYLDQAAAGTADISSVNLTGISDTQKSFIQSLIYSKEQKPCWVLVADELRARLAAQELRAFLGSESMCSAPRSSSAGCQSRFSGTRTQTVGHLAENSQS